MKIAQNWQMRSFGILILSEISNYSILTSRLLIILQIAMYMFNEKTFVLISQPVKAETIYYVLARVLSSLVVA